MNEFSQIDFGPLKQFLENDDITDISYEQWWTSMVKIVITRSI